MQLILNVSFQSHFVALFDAEGVLVDSLTWDDFRAGGQLVWAFLKKHQIGQGQDLTFIGGISGPGGFSTLRVGGAILNALAVRFELPVHQVRADVIARALIGSDDFLLNSFGDGVFVSDSDDLKRLPVSEIPTKKPLFVDWLPAEKRDRLQALTVEKDIVQTTFKVLKEQDKQSIFRPDYEFPPVQQS